MKSAFYFLAVFFIATALTEAEDQKTYLVGYLRSLQNNVLTEAELNAKGTPELLDLVIASLKKVKAEAKEPERAQAIGNHLGYFERLKGEDSNNSPARSEPYSSSNQESEVPQADSPAQQPSGDGKVIHIDSEEDFDNQVKNAGSKLVVVDFFATWCGPCKRIAPILDTLAQTHASKIVILKVDVDQLNELASGRYVVSSMPTFIFLKDGKTVERFSGADVGRINETINKYSN